MKFNILTLPKLSLGIFFIILIIAGIQFSSKSIISELLEYPIYYLVLGMAIIYLFVTCFDTSEVIDQYPISSFIALPLSLILSIGDYLLISALINSDKNAYDQIYIPILVIAIFWVPIGLGLFNLVDKIVKFIRNN